MQKYILCGFLALFVGSLLLVQAKETATESIKDPAVKAFAELDDYFVEQYRKIGRLRGQTTKPILVVNGFDYELHLKNGEVKTLDGLRNPFNELKSVSHIGPGLYAIAAASWQNLPNNNWKENLRQYQTHIQAALQEVNRIDWNNPAWTAETPKLQKFMQDSLQMANQFIEKILQKDSFTLEDYQTFSEHYIHTMEATMYLSNVGNTLTVVDQLKRWKEELGPEQWDSVYVLIMGSKGRSTSELTLETNTAALTVASVMKPELIKSHIIIMPNAQTLEQAQNSLGAVLTAADLAHATFVTERAQERGGLYKTLLSSDIPLARDNVAHIADENALKGKVELPYLGILPKDQAFMELGTQVNSNNLNTPIPAK